MKRSRNTVLALALSLGALPLGCSDDAPCGPGEVVGSNVTALSTEGQFMFDGFTSSPNNDCPVTGAPTAITIEAQQSSPPTSLRASLTFCLPRPDLIGDTPVALSDDTLIQIIDVTQRADDGCIVTLDRSIAATGTMTFIGFCGDGQGSEGYSLSIDGTVGGQLQCNSDGGVNSTPLAVTLRGTAAVAAPR